MREGSRVFATTLALALAPALARGSAHGQQSGASAVTGSVTLGLRSVDVSGTDAKFMEDVNLDDGVRVFDANIIYSPASGSDAPIDRMELRANNLGGDPFQSIHFGALKFGRYDLKLDHRRSEYFYADTILPAGLASVSGSTGGDYHRFDFERVRDTAALDIHVSPATQLSIGLEHQTRTGDSTTTLDIARDEFELERPLDETLNAFGFGVRHAFEKITLIFDERISKFENSSELFLPGASSGQNTDDLSELLFFRLDQSYDYDSRGHRLTVLADPTERLSLRGSVYREDLDLVMRASEESLGTDFTGLPLATDLTGSAGVARDLEHYTFDFAYTIGDRIRLVAGARRNDLQQDGTLLFGPDLGAGATTIETDGFEAGVEIAATANVVVTTGWSMESRSTSYVSALGDDSASGAVDTDRDGYFARLVFRTDGGSEITASVENNSIDDPFTLASATATRRYKLRFRHRWENGFALVGNYRRSDAENDASGWGADTEQTDLRLSYRRDRLELSAGAGIVDLSREIVQLVTGGTRQDMFDISYDADARFQDLGWRWAAGPRLTLGGDARAYENRGSYPLERDDLRIYMDIAVTSRYGLLVSYRDIDYSEDEFDAYDARILELGLQLRL